MLSTSGIKYLDLGLICAIGPSILGASCARNDCWVLSRLQRCSKRLHKLEHITMSNIIFCVCGGWGWGRVKLGPKRPIQIGPKRPTLKPGRKRPSRNDQRPKRLTTETVRNLCSCATSAFLCPGIGRYIGHWPIYRSFANVITSCGRIHSGFFDIKYCYPRGFIGW